MRTCLALAFGLFLLAYAASARAQGNEFSAPTGGRTALMGNTGVALSSDGAAPFLNPATIVRIRDQHLAFSVNFFTLSLTHYSGWHQPTAADPSLGNLSLDGTGMSSLRFTPLPSTLCLFFTVGGIGEGNDVEDTSAPRRGRQKLALCLGSIENTDTSVPAISFQSGTANGSTQQAQSMSVKWNRLHVGPTYSVQLTDQLAIGLSLHAVYTSDSFAINSSAITSGVTAPIASSLGASGDGHSFDMTALLGGTYRMGRYTLGASVQVPALHVFGSYDGVLSSQVTSAAGSATVSNGSGSFNAAPPVRAAVGFGGEWKRIVAEVDASYDFASANALAASVSTTTTSLLNGASTVATTNAAYSIRSRPTANISAGAEYFVTPAFSLVGGIGTNISTTPALAPTVSIGNLIQARQQGVNVSFGIGSYGDSGELLLGTQLGYGWGQAIAVNPYVLPNNFVAVDTQSYSALLVLAGATDLRTLKRAVERVENAVTKGRPDDNAPGAPTPTPSPAPK